GREDAVGPAEIFEQALVRVLHAPGQHPERVTASVPELSGGNTQAGIFERLEPERDPPLGAVSLLPGAILWRLELEASLTARGGATGRRHARGELRESPRIFGIIPEGLPSGGKGVLCLDQRRDEALPGEEFQRQSRRLRPETQVGPEVEVRRGVRIARDRGQP